MTDELDLGPLVPITHGEALTESAAEDRTRFLVENLIPAGTVGTIAGIPETGKSFVAQRIVTCGAQGAGDILGYLVERQFRSGYVWQDDSRREELERISVYADATDSADPDLPIFWFLNLGVQLPRDIERLRDAVLRYELELLILDSFYTVVGDELELKHGGAELVVKALKREICDVTGCTVGLVDHMTWGQDDTPRQRLRAYGGVFKSAATRWGIYLDVNGTKLSVEVRGNNIAGFKRRAAWFDSERLEIRLAEQAEDRAALIDERAEKLIAALEALPTNDAIRSKTACRKLTGGNATTADQALAALIASDRVKSLSEIPWTGPDGKTHTTGYIASIHAAPHGDEPLSLLNETGTDRRSPGLERVQPVRPPLGGQAHGRTWSDDPETADSGPASVSGDTREERNAARPRATDDGSVVDGSSGALEHGANGSEELELAELEKFVGEDDDESGDGEGQKPSAAVVADPEPDF